MICDKCYATDIFPNDMKFFDNYLRGKVPFLQDYVVCGKDRPAVSNLMIYEMIPGRKLEDITWHEPIEDRTVRQSLTEIVKSVATKPIETLEHWEEARKRVWLNAKVRTYEKPIGRLKLSLAETVENRHGVDEDADCPYSTYKYQTVLEFTRVSPPVCKFRSRNGEINYEGNNPLFLALIFYLARVQTGTDSMPPLSVFSVLISKKYGPDARRDFFNKMKDTHAQRQINMWKDTEVFMTKNGFCCSLRTPLNNYSNNILTINSNSVNLTVKSDQPQISMKTPITPLPELEKLGRCMYETDVGT